MLKYCENWNGIYISKATDFLYLWNFPYLLSKTMQKNWEIFYFWSIHCFLIARAVAYAKGRGRTQQCSGESFFSRHMSHSHYNSSLWIIKFIFKCISKPFSSEWDIKHRLQEGTAEIAVPSASSPVKPLSSSFVNTFAPIVCCLPWHQTAQVLLLFSYCFSPTLYVANCPALLTSASGGTQAPQQQTWSPTGGKHAHTVCPPLNLQHPLVFRVGSGKKH